MRRWWGGAAYAVENALYNQAILETTATNAVLLTNLSTIWVAVGAFFIFGEKLSPRFWLGVIVALAGVALVVDIDLRRFALSNTGDLMAIGSSFLYAAYMLITQRTREKVSAYLYLVLTMLSASVVLFFLSIFQGFDLLGLAPRSYLNLFLVALIGQTVGFLSINFAQGHIPATRVAIFLLAQPVVILILGYFLLFEYPSLPQLLGVGIVLAGIYIVNHQEKSVQ
ncbi:MAG: DMT family transporter [Anaerolineae bacterium]|nr:DMT family transporter [Anaerolineae bacterium]